MSTFFVVVIEGAILRESKGSNQYKKQRETFHVA
jgi:hypothetical protein